MPIRLKAFALLTLAAAGANADTPGGPKFARVVSSFQTTWTEAFAGAGRTFPLPRMAAYSNGTQTACGALPGGNAYYCDADNAIYFDAQFFQMVRERVSERERTDGDYGPMAIIGHEFGHAVAFHLLPTGSLHDRLKHRISQTD